MDYLICVFDIKTDYKNFNDVKYARTIDAIERVTFLNSSRKRLLIIINTLIRRKMEYHHIINIKSIMIQKSDQETIFLYRSRDRRSRIYTTNDL